MTDTQALAAAITAAIQAPRTPGPRDPKYESPEVMPETGSPDLLERSAFRSAHAYATAPLGVRLLIRFSQLPPNPHPTNSFQVYYRPD